MIIALIAALAAGASEPSWQSLADESGWKDVGSKKSEVGLVQVRSKRIDGVGCVEGSSLVTTSAARLAAVTQDMVSAKQWSSADLAASELLASDADSFVLYQYFDAPGWTFAADRYWVIRGEPRFDGAAGSYRWTREHAEVAFPEAAARAKAISKGVIEPPTNYGEWTFGPAEGGTAVRYRACADFGGSLPTAVQQWVNTQQVPNLVTDLVLEAERR